MGTSDPSLQLLIGTKGRRLLHILETHSRRSESPSWTSCQPESFQSGLQEGEREREREEFMMSSYCTHQPLKFSLEQTEKSSVFQTANLNLS